MANPIITGKLPAPHDCISISVTQWFRDEWCVRYKGTPQQLVAAGVVDDDMACKINSQKGGARTGKDGIRFKLRSGRTPARIQWARDEVVEFDRTARDLKQMMQLPGMAQLFPNGAPADEPHDDDVLTHGSWPRNSL